MRCICIKENKWFSLEDNLTNNLDPEEFFFTFEEDKEYEYEVKKDFYGNLYIVKHYGKNFIIIPDDVFTKSFKIKN